MSKTSDLLFFYLLKEEVARQYISKNPSCSKAIYDWTGEDIRNFQDDVSEQVNERLSERWFYTHLKVKENEKTPRIDMLNILCRYTGYMSWDDFKLKNNTKVEEEEKENEIVEGRKVNKLKWFWIASILTLIIVGMSYVFNNNVEQESKHVFCFYDKDSKMPIVDVAVEITVLNKNESPLKMRADENACLEIETKKEYIKFVVNAQYYKTDTIERAINSGESNEVIELRRDDYALMIQYFATSDIKDWEKRRAQLDEMINDNAVIFQITESNTGMEMYNKTDFIDKLTMPIESLGDIEIIETVYEGEKIINMRFIQK